MSAATILFVDDNADLRQTVKSGLARDGYDVVGAGSGHEMLSKLHLKPDLILLDLILPGESGLYLIGKIREHTDAPVIVVSGKGDMVDKVVGLEMGADDYVAKPFQMPELSARIKAQLRRYQGVAAPPMEKTGTVPRKIRFGRWILDTPRLQVFDESGRSANLTVKEFRLLEILVNAPNRVLSREQLLDKSRADDFNVTDRAIDTQITRIRKKIHDDVGGVALIQAVRGVGYILASDTEALSV